jgi:DUF1680 family protein
MSSPYFKDLIDQIELCEYEDKDGAGYLRNNQAWQKLRGVLLVMDMVRREREQGNVDSSDAPRGTVVRCGCSGSQGVCED